LRGLIRHKYYAQAQQAEFMNTFCNLFFFVFQPTMHYLQKSVQWIETAFPLKWFVAVVPVNASVGILLLKTEKTASLVSLKSIDFSLNKKTLSC
jgi:hypothetical protein